ncbi:MAG: hypothetical protein AAF358_19905 [Pseudomonadota bacterium]
MTIKTFTIATAAAAGLLLTGANVNTALHSHLHPVRASDLAATDGKTVGKSAALHVAKFQPHADALKLQGMNND